MKKRSSPIWKMSKEQFKDLVTNSHTYMEVLKFFGLTHQGNYKTLKQRIIEERVDVTHFYSRTYAIALSKIGNMIPLSEVMVENSSYSRTNLKRRLLKDGLLENVCSLCGQLPNWKNKNLVLILDHINGVSNDNRLGNLRLVCPNCNSQLDTSRGQLRKKHYYCKDCGKAITKQSKNNRCVNCTNKNQPRKVERPSKEELEELVKTMSMIKIGKKFGVTDNTIRKWIKYYNIEFKGYSRGHWAKVYANKIQ